MALPAVREVHERAKRYRQIQPQEEQDSIRAGIVTRLLYHIFCSSMGAALLLGGCASLTPEGGPLSLNVEGLRRTELPASEGTQWDYTLVIHNPNRRSATLIQEALTLAWDGVYRTEGIEGSRQEVPARGHLRLRRTSVFRRSEFEASSAGAPGRPANARAGSKGMWIYWQFLGRHEGGGGLILNFDFFPERTR